MNITETSPARQIRVEVYEAGAVTRVADSPKRAGPGPVLRNISLYIVPRVIEDRAVSIAKLAYLMAERRGFRPGHELEDWLAAENEVDQRLAGEGRVF
jgi:Protein of unknown function (DUF2934)